MRTPQTLVPNCLNEEKPYFLHVKCKRCLAEFTIMTALLNTEKGRINVNYSMQCPFCAEITYLHPPFDYSNKIDTKSLEISNKFYSCNSYAVYKRCARCRDPLERDWKKCPKCQSNEYRESKSLIDEL